MKLLAPEIVAEEWISKRADDPETAVDRLVSEVNSLERHPSVSEQAWFSGLLAKSNALTPATIRRVKKRVFLSQRERFSNIGMTIMPLSKADTSKVVPDYFQGNPPFAQGKSRKDFPDAFIYAILKHQAEKSKRTIFVCDDTKLRESIEKLGLICTASVSELLELEQIKSLQTTPFAKWWNRSYSEFATRLSDSDQWLEGRLDDAAIDAVAGRSIHYTSEFSDGDRAFADSAGGLVVRNINWEECVSVASGILVVPIEFEIELNISFDVHRSEAYHVPDRISVEILDPEFDAYFPAYTDQVAYYTADLVLGYDESLMDAPANLWRPNLDLKNVELEELA